MSAGFVGHIAFIAWRRPVVTDVARSVVCVVVCTGHIGGEQCKNDCTDRNAVSQGDESHLCGLWAQRWMGCTLTPPGEYDRTIRVRW